MSLLQFALFVALAVSTGCAALYIFRLTSLFCAGVTAAHSGAGRQSMGITHRYRPMLRLLSEDDLGAVRNNRKLLRKVRSERVAIFRGYVKCISRDYARLLAGIGLSAVQSATDRPDLAWAVFRNRMWFAGALCRLDAMVFFYRFGMCGVDVSGLVEAMDALRAFTNATVRVASPAPLAA